MKRLLKIKSQKAFFLLLTVILILLTTVIAYTQKGANKPIIETYIASPQRLTESNGLNSQAITPQAKATYLIRGRLWQDLMPAVDALGSRLEKTGFERTTLIGTISRPNQSGGAKLPLRLFLERPGRVRLEEQNGSRKQTTIFDDQSGKGLSKDGETPTEDDENKIETLAFDITDRFFLGLIDGQAARLIGLRFRMDDGKTANYTGPFYDVYQMLDDVGVTGERRSQHKLFLFNSNTHLLEIVRYELTRNGQKTKVEIQYKGWQQFNGHTFPTNWTRTENRTPVWTLEFSSVIVGPSLPDNIFNRL